MPLLLLWKGHARLDAQNRVLGAPVLVGEENKVTQGWAAVKWNHIPKSKTALITIFIQLCYILFLYSYVVYEHRSCFSDCDWVDSYLQCWERKKGCFSKKIYTVMFTGHVLGQLLISALKNYKKNSLLVGGPSLRSYISDGWLICTKYLQYNYLKTNWICIAL